MTTKILAAIIAISSVACARYGAASPESCYAKYVRDGKGDRYRDNYSNCMARFRSQTAVIAENNEHDGERRSSGGFWTGVTAGAVAASAASRPGVTCTRLRNGNYWCY